MMDRWWQLAQLHADEGILPRTPEVREILQKPQQSQGMVRNQPITSLLKTLIMGK